MNLHAWLRATSIPREWLGDASSTSKLCCFPQPHQYLGNQQQDRVLGHHCLGLILTPSARKTSVVAVAGRLPATLCSPWGEEHACMSTSKRLPRLKGSKTLLKAKSYWSARHSTRREKSTTCLEHAHLSTECEERSRQALHKANFIGKKPREITVTAG